MSGAINYGDRAAREVSERVASVSADTATLQAIPPAQRAHGMFAVVEPGSLWMFDATSAASAGATVLVPDDGDGRWLMCAGEAQVAALATYLHAPVANEAALAAIPAASRANGMLCVVEPSDLWVFDADSAASAGATVVVPDAGTGRWVAAALPA